jgi:hypothetical protein
VQLDTWAHGVQHDTWVHGGAASAMQRRGSTWYTVTRGYMPRVVYGMHTWRWPAQGDVTDADTPPLLLTMVFECAAMFVFIITWSYI